MPRINNEEFDRLLNESVDFFVNNNFVTEKQEKIKKYFKGETDETLVDFYVKITTDIKTEKKEEEIANKILVEENNIVKTFFENYNSIDLQKKILIKNISKLNTTKKIDRHN